MEVRVYEGDTEIEFKDGKATVDGIDISLDVINEKYNSALDKNNDCYLVKYKRDCFLKYRFVDEDCNVMFVAYYIRYSGFFVIMTFEVTRDVARKFIDRVMHWQFDALFRAITWNGLRVRLDRQFYSITPKQLTMWDETSLVIYSRDIENMRKLSGTITCEQNGFYRLEDRRI